jgi:hypothetical protein
MDQSCDAWLGVVGEFARNTGSPFLIETKEGSALAVFDVDFQNAGAPKVFAEFVRAGSQDRIHVCEMGNHKARVYVGASAQGVKNEMLEALLDSRTLAA